MGPIGHFSVGLAAKTAVPKVPLGVLLLATWVLDVLAIAFGFAGIEKGGTAGLPWSHGLFMSIIWSVIAALLAARIYRDNRAGEVVGLLVFSHWVLDFRFPSHTVFQLFLAFVAMELWTCPAVRSPASFRKLAESGTRLVQLHQRGRSHGIGVWDVHSGSGSVRNLC